MSPAEPRKWRRFISFPPVLPNLPRRAKLRQRKRGAILARDGQGLEVSNANAEAIAGARFRCARNGWPSASAWPSSWPPPTRKRSAAAAADRGQPRALHEFGRRLRGGHAATSARAKAMTSGANARELAWLAATEAWIAGETPVRAEDPREHGRRMAARPARRPRSASSMPSASGDAEGILRIGERIVRGQRATTTTSGRCMPSAWRSATASTRPRPLRARRSRWTAAIPGRTTPSPIAWKRAAGWSRAWPS